VANFSRASAGLNMAVQEEHCIAWKRSGEKGGGINVEIYAFDYPTAKKTLLNCQL